jgi:hypothetical protein
LETIQWNFILQSPSIINGFCNGLLVETFGAATLRPMSEVGNTKMSLEAMEYATIITPLLEAS